MSKAKAVIDSMMNSDMVLYEKILDTPGFAFHFNELVKIALIEHGPEVSEEWLRQKAGELSTHRFSNQHPEIAHDWLCRTFREARVTVKED